jgi:hypothetical protein
MYSGVVHAWSSLARFSALLVPLHFYSVTNGQMDFHSPSFRRAFAIAGFIGIRMLIPLLRYILLAWSGRYLASFNIELFCSLSALYYNVPIFLSCFILFLSSSRSSSHAWSVPYLLAVPNPHIVLVIQLPIIASVLVFTQSILFA